MPGVATYRKCRSPASGAAAPTAVGEPAPASTAPSKRAPEQIPHPAALFMVVAPPGRCRRPAPGARPGWIAAGEIVAGRAAEGASFFAPGKHEPRASALAAFARGSPGIRFNYYRVI